MMHIPVSFSTCGVDEGRWATEGRCEYAYCGWCSDTCTGLLVGGSGLKLGGAGADA